IPRQSFSMLCAQRYGQLSGRASNCACRDSFSICASLQPKLPQITQICADAIKTDRAIARISRMFVGQALRLPASATGGCPTVNREAALRSTHVGAGSGVDFDRFAFLDEKRHVNGLAGFELCRFGDVTGSVAPQTFR